MTTSMEQRREGVSESDETFAVRGESRGRVVLVRSYAAPALQDVPTLLRSRSEGAEEDQEVRRGERCDERRGADCGSVQKVGEMRSFLEGDFEVEAVKAVSKSATFSPGGPLFVVEMRVLSSTSRDLLPGEDVCCAFRQSSMSAAINRIRMMELAAAFKDESFSAWVNALVETLNWPEAQVPIVGRAKVQCRLLKLRSGKMILKYDFKSFDEVSPEIAPDPETVLRDWLARKLAPKTEAKLPPYASDLDLEEE